MSEDFKRELVERRKNVIPVVGAGVSLYATQGEPLASWKGLLANGLRRCQDVAVDHNIDDAWVAERLKQLESPLVDDLLSVATLVSRLLRRKPEEYRRWLRETVGALVAKHTDVADLLHGVPIATTNYDGLLESITGRTAITWHEPARVFDVLNDPARAAKSIVHLHGYWDDSDSVVLGIDSYETLLGSKQAQTLQQLLVGSRTLLFIGFGAGLSDPNFETLLAWVSSSFEGVDHIHYQLVRSGDIDAARARHGSHVRVLSYGENFTDLPAFLKSIFDADNGAVVIPPTPAQKRTVPPPPNFEADDCYVTRFVGRENLLGALDDAMKGLTERAAGRAPSSYAANAQLFFLHGFGGMGKTWLVRRASIEAHKRGIAVAMIDWDDQVWRTPLTKPPVIPAEMFAAIAERLAQVRGIEALNVYWDAEAAVREAADEHSSLRFEFQNILVTLARYGDRWRESPEVTIASSSDKRYAKRVFLMEEQLKNANTTAEHVRGSQPRSRQMFALWAAEALACDSSDPRIAPSLFLGNALRRCVEASCVTQPLMFIFDTCELLSEELDGWLRYVMSPPLVAGAHLLLLIGSRIAPDVGLPLGSKDGWLPTVPTARIRLQRFDEGVLFTVGDVTQMLAKVQPPVSSDPVLAESLNRLSRGVPLVLRVLLDLHEQGSDVLQTLGHIDDADTDGDESEAVQKAIETISDRFLLHLQNRPELAGDFRDIIAIGLLLHPTPEVLARYWGIDDARPRSRYLARRHSILASGDLHETVRAFIRLNWRVAPPPDLPSVAQRLRSVLTEQVVPEPLPPNLRLELLNLQSWLDTAGFYADSYRAAITMLVQEEPVEELRALVDETRPATQQERDTKEKLTRFLNAAEWFDIGVDDLRAVESRVTARWSEYERASLDLLTALGLSEWDRHAEAIQRYERAMEFFKGNPPLRNRVARSYLLSAAFVGFSGEIAGAAARALDWGTRLEGDPDWRMIGMLAATVPRPEQAKAAFEKLISSGRADDVVWHQLGHIHAQSGHHGDAIRAFSHATRLDPNDEGNWVCRARFQLSIGKKRLALRSLERALQANPSSVKAMLSFAIHARDLPGREEQAAEALRKVKDYSGNDGSTLNDVAWQLYLIDEMADAESFALRAVEARPKDIHSEHTLATILLKRGKWTQAQPYITHIAQLNDIEPPPLGEEYFVPMMAESFKQQSQATLDVVGTLKVPLWRSLVLAVNEAYAGGSGVFADQPPTLREKAAVIFASLRS